jgi:hypothetical protein
VAWISGTLPAVLVRISNTALVVTLWPAAVLSVGVV